MICTIIEKHISSEYEFDFNASKRNEQAHPNDISTSWSISSSDKSRIWPTTDNGTISDDHEVRAKFIFFYKI
jgi:hypothetical protein